MSVCLITGSEGQDGRLLRSDLANEFDGEVVCVSGPNGRISETAERETHFSLDVQDPEGLSDLVATYRPDFIFHFAAKSSVSDSWANPLSTFAINTQGTLNVLEAVRTSSPESKVILAGSSEIFKRGLYEADEFSAVLPSSPYGVSKAASLELGRLYREVHGLRITNAIMFNHESNLRPSEFVSRHIAIQAARVKLGLIPVISLRDLSSSKDWGWAPDFVWGLLMAAKSTEHSDYIFASGVRTSVLQLAQFSLAALDLETDRVQEVSDGKNRPNDSQHPTGNSGKALSQFGWRATTGPEKFMKKMTLHALGELQVG